MLFDRALVLAADEDVGLEVLDSRTAELVVDGNSTAKLEGGQTLHCRAGAHDALLVHFGERDFRHILKRKFGLTDR